MFSASLRDGCQMDLKCDKQPLLDFRTSYPHFWCYLTSSEYISDLDINLCVLYLDQSTSISDIDRGDVRI